MKHVILTLGIFGMGFLMSCENATETDTTEIVEQKDAGVDEDHSTEGHAEHDGISLNNGEKWEVNEEMKPFVMRGEELVSEYIKSGNKDYNDLAVQVSAENKQLVSSCTMEGRSHEELHKWLHPHIELTEELKTTEDIDQADYNVSLLMDSYMEYHKYFK